MQIEPAVVQQTEGETPLGQQTEGEMSTGEMSRDGRRNVVKVWSMKHCVAPIVIALLLVGVAAAGVFYFGGKKHSGVLNVGINVTVEQNATSGNFIIYLLIFFILLSLDTDIYSRFFLWCFLTI